MKCLLLHRIAMVRTHLAGIARHATGLAAPLPRFGPDMGTAGGNIKSGIGESLDRTGS